MKLERKKGVIHSLFRHRNFGFIMDEDLKKHFFHRTSIAADFDSLIEGLGVEFSLIPDAKNVNGEISRSKAVFVKVVGPIPDEFKAVNE